MAIGFSPLAAPTARVASTSPTLTARSLYDQVSPYGISRSADQTRSWKDVPWIEQLAAERSSLAAEILLQLLPEPLEHGGLRRLERRGVLIPERLQPSLQAILVREVQQAEAIALCAGNQRPYGRLEPLEPAQRYRFRRSLHIAERTSERRCRDTDLAGLPRPGSDQCQSPRIRPISVYCSV
jgi:hypothetical protein